MLLKRPQVANVLTEEHGFWIDFRCVYEVRLVFLELGQATRRRRRTGRCRTTCFCPHRRTRCGRRPRRCPGRDRPAPRCVAERRAELSLSAAITPAAGARDAAIRAAAHRIRSAVAIVKMFGGGPPPPSGRARPSCSGNSRLAGQGQRAGAGGPLAGRGRPAPALAMSWWRNSRRRPWTPLFATAAAVVTDAGGILSHCAVVAREYGIPAVVGTARATATIRDGQQVEVDGNAGLVRLLED